MRYFNYSSNSQSYNPNDLFVVHLSEIKNKDELLKQLNDKLLFPDYFGYNWNAVFDLLCDFHWIEQKGIVLVHDDLPILGKKDFEIYLEVLIDSIRSWKEDDEHSFEVVFPESAKKLICSVLSQL